MATSPPTSTEDATETRLRPAVHRTLRVGSAVGVALLIAGLAVLSASGGPSSPTGTSRLSASAIRAALLQPSGDGLLVLGAVVLALTPMSRVVLATSVFSRARDRPLLAASSFVLAILVLTVVVGVFA